MLLRYVHNFTCSSHCLQYVAGIVAQVFNLNYSIDRIFRLLVFSRILYPGSRKKAFENRGIFFDNFKGFSLDDVYYSLDIIARNQEDLQKWIFDHSDHICERDLSVSYFDCTNYYFDIGRPDTDTLDEEGNLLTKKGKIISVMAMYTGSPSVARTRNSKHILHL